MKRKIFVSGLVAFALVISMFGSAFALSKDEYQEIGKALEGLKMVQGSNGDLMYDSEITRQDAVIVLLRMLGLADEAQKTAGTKKAFDDIKLDHYSAKFIAFAKEKGLTSGISKTEFGLDRTLTQKEMLTFMLKALDYKVDWQKDNILELAEKADLLDDLDVKLGANILRKDVFLLMKNTLISKKRGSKHILAEELAAAGKLPQGSEVFIEALKADHDHEHDHGHGHKHDDLKVTFDALEKMGVSHGLAHAMAHSRSDIKFPKDEKNPAKLKEYMASITYLNIDKFIAETGDVFALKGYEYLTGLKILSVLPRQEKEGDEILTTLTDEQVQKAFKKYPNLAEVETLDFEKTGLKTFEFVKMMPNLKILYLYYNEIENLSALKVAASLERFGAPYNKITDISGVEGQKNLKMFNAGNNEVSDIKALKGLAPTYVYLQNNKITGVSAISSDKTEFLNLSGNKKLDHSTIVAKNLETLNVSETGLKSLQDLKASDTMLTLWANKNEITDLKGISKFKILENIRLADNKITSFKPDAKHSALLNLDVSNNNLSSWDGAEGFANLVNVKIGDNKNLKANPKYYGEILKNSHLGKFVNAEGRIYVVHNDHDHLESLKSYLRNVKVDFQIDNAEIIGVNEDAYYINHMIKPGYYNVFKISGRPQGVYKLPQYYREHRKETIKIDDAFAAKLNAEMVEITEKKINKISDQADKNEKMAELKKITTEKDQYKLNEALFKLDSSIK